MAHRSDDNDAPGWLSTRRIALGVRHPLYRLARPVCRRSASGVSDPLHSRLGSRIPLLADAHGALRRRTSITRLGIADRAQGHFLADSRAGGRAHALERTFQISA